MIKGNDDDGSKLEERNGGRIDVDIPQTATRLPVIHLLVLPEAEIVSWEGQRCFKILLRDYHIPDQALYPGREVLPALDTTYLPTHLPNLT